MRSGFVCLGGAPNVGKSTLLNRLVGKPISITAPKPQTTRNRIMGVKTAPDHQMVLVDTPGLHHAQDPLNQRMVSYAVSALQDADLILLMTVPLKSGKFAQPEALETALQVVRKAAAPVLVVINKIDQADDAQVLETIRWFNDTQEKGSFEEIVPISALKGRGVERLEQLIPAYLPEGPAYFEADQITDQSEQMIIAELVRQEVFRRMHQEIPYSTAVVVERMEETPERLSIYAKIFVERDSQKGMVIGKQGKMLKAIGQSARLKMESLLGTSIFLGLQVAVLKDWSRNARRLNDLGYPEG